MSDEKKARRAGSYQSGFSVCRRAHWLYAGMDGCSGTEGVRGKGGVRAWQPQAAPWARHGGELTYQLKPRWIRKKRRTKVNDVRRSERETGEKSVVAVGGRRVKYSQWAKAAAEEMMAAIPALAGQPGHRNPW
jgi:hypothetical protein